MQQHAANRLLARKNGSPARDPSRALARPRHRAIRQAACLACFE
jgi:hypothetical protein